MPYPPIEPYQTGLLETGDGNQVYWEACGNPNGLPALVVHGGPGSGCSAGQRKRFDPARHRIILFDQRNCGRSKPHASDPAADMSRNTTTHLIGDMEQLREFLGVDRWLLYGGSWGVTLSLAYAQRQPDRVAGMLLVSVTSTRRLELDWLYRGAGRFNPGWVPVVRERTEAEWMSWEDAVISGEVNGSPGLYSSRVDEARVAFVRICSHYFGHDGLLADGQLIVIEDSGHTGSATMSQVLDDATKRLSEQATGVGHV